MHYKKHKKIRLADKNTSIMNEKSRFTLNIRVVCKIRFVKKRWQVFYPKAFWCSLGYFLPTSAKWGLVFVKIPISLTFFKKFLLMYRVNTNWLGDVYACRLFIGSFFVRFYTFREQKCSYLHLWGGIIIYIFCTKAQVFFLFFYLVCA